MGKPELIEDPRFINNSRRVENYIPTLKGIIEDWSMQHSVDELEELISGAGVPFGRIQNIKQACECDVIRRRNMIWDVYDPAFGREIEMPGTPIKMHGCADRADKAAPGLGEDTERLLCGILGLGHDEVEKLREEGVV